MADTPEKIEDLSFATAADISYPPPKGMTPRPGQIICGDIDMRIDTNGTWFYHGLPITRKKTRTIILNRRSPRRGRSLLAYYARRNGSDQGRRCTIFGC